eukprot:8034782-Pyramimonas_sp.AAC.1
MNGLASQYGRGVGGQGPCQQPKTLDVPRCASPTTSSGPDNHIDLSFYIQTHMCPHDYISMRMDIEGAEYEVVSKLARDGVFCWINKLELEWHQLYRKSDKQGAVCLEQAISSHAKKCGVELIEETM